MNLKKINNKQLKEMIMYPVLSITKITHDVQPKANKYNFLMFVRQYGIILLFYRTNALLPT